MLYLGNEKLQVSETFLLVGRNSRNCNGKKNGVAVLEKTDYYTQLVKFLQRYCRKTYGSKICICYKLWVEKIHKSIY